MIAGGRSTAHNSHIFGNTSLLSETDLFLYGDNPSFHTENAIVHVFKHFHLYYTTSYSFSGAMIDHVVPGKNLSPTTLVAIVVLITLFYAQKVEIAETTTTESRDYERHLISLQAFGSNPINHYPLDRCQGDCDLDSECRGRLICFQRRGYESVPGCEGGREDSTPSDYCVDPADLTAQPLLTFLGINPPIQEFPLQGMYQNDS